MRQKNTLSALIDVAVKEACSAHRKLAHGVEDLIFDGRPFESHAAPQGEAERVLHHSKKLIQKDLTEYIQYHVQLRLTEAVGIAAQEQAAYLALCARLTEDQGKQLLTIRHHMTRDIDGFYQELEARNIEYHEAVRTFYRKQHLLTLTQLFVSRFVSLETAGKLAQHFLPTETTSAP